MRAILIDPFTRKVKEIQTKAIVDDLYKILQVELITVANLGDGHAMILDDEGFLQPKEKQAYFALKGADQPFAGRGLILADEGGENRDATLPLSVVERKVVWLDNDQVDPDVWNHWTFTTF